MIKQLRIAVIATIVMMAATGLVYPFAMTGLAQVIFPHRANGRTAHAIPLDRLQAAMRKHHRGVEAASR